MATRNLLRRLDLTTLQLFLAVFEEGTLTRAAEREAIAVSAASKRLLELEQAVGAALFERKARGMALTPAGETLLHHARRVLRDVENIGIELAEHASGVRGYVRMMANLSAIVEFLPEDLRAFSSVHEQIKIDLEERPSGGIVEGVADSLVDLGICSGDADTRGLETAHYRHDRLALVMPGDHPLAKRASIAFAQTLDFDHIGLHSASSINQRTHLAARQAGRALRLRIHVPGFDAVCRMVQAGMGVGVLPMQVFEAMGRQLGLAAVALDDDWAARSLVIVVRDSDALSPVSRLLFDHLRTVEAGI
ncbi:MULTISPECIES: LysR family transcriptional regulator [Caballeronia]|jgi:DNA-binding transcriptional LysR family regulator|uniref:LysR family transcriptional regulator n=1 Tax=Caballeronia zhejiangensis TaxID=871203 RepID=A0A656QLZ8_9BURK|nr:MULTISPECIES: LysR family transcriptional regulator [Caballeronia]EKS66694.1 LysR family transcriptional regulator [Burkholderia sp. SJ98]KDR30956.1 LysR family transcriptional regulator [Caballeronia zhejiangensis]MCG7401962.1 LysR family transcriptional regulator [Caballeronia zhejiangensis]MCI1042635.1 LysR family transcriptional regulator [Caballeronia zhejiangensis]MDR5768627.1 LysR family transcriptional regulator [Caballeronia sp. LZ028]